MFPRYNIHFVPHYEDRLKLSKLRQKVCKESFGTKALQFPIHMSLISGGFTTKDLDGLLEELKTYCTKKKALVLPLGKETETIDERHWAGIHVGKTKKIDVFRTELQKIRNKYAEEKEKHYFHPPHITLSYPGSVHELPKFKVPVQKLVFDRLTILKRDSRLGKYKIYIHIPFKA